MATKIDTVSSREKLKPRREPYWHRLAKGATLGYRKMANDSGGTWIARLRDELTGKQHPHPLGRLEDVLPSARFDAACKAAAEWFAHMGRGGSTTEITVGEACRRFVQKKRDEGKEAAALDLEVRFKRWMHSDPKLSNTPLTKLTQGMVHDWRAKLVQSPALLQDKSQKGTALRAASTINREMAVFKAALNQAMSDGYATTDVPWKAKLKPIRNATGRRDCYLDVDQRRALLSKAPADLATLIRAWTMLPFRPGVLAAMEVSKFDKRLGQLTIGKDKSGKDRKIKLPPATAAFFAEQSVDKLPAAPLFARADGQFWNKDSWKYPFKDAVIAAKLPANATAYALRHSTITDLIVRHGLDTLTVAKLSGTSLKMIEEHYGHLLEQRGADALALLAL